VGNRFRTLITKGPSTNELTFLVQNTTQATPHGVTGGVYKARVNDSRGGSDRVPPLN